ncbi:MAG: DUF47 family protein [Spirochaetes bacterium]|nr:DUF47 family protein [Spirochaetota bacterium]
MKKLNLFNTNKKADFYSLLIEHSQKVYDAYHIMYRSMDKNDNEGFERIFFLEREADDLRRILIEKLNKTLITPFDREDVFTLSRSVDDIIDAAKSTVEEISVFRVSVTEDLKEMISILERGTLEILDSLKNLKNHPEVALEHAKRAKATENEMNHLYLKSIANIFDNKDNTPSYMMKMREIYRHLNRSADRCDEAANIISDIIIKTG